MTPGADRALRVVHVPAQHPYVDHVREADGPAVADGGPVGPARSGLPVFTWDDEPSWVAEHAEDFDVLHVHFGFERCSPGDLRRLLDALALAGRPLVWTAHDLTNPHLHDQTRHEQQLAMLAEHAAVVLTLTPGAAAEIERRWGRRATVVAHPHLAPVQVLGRVRASPVGDPVVGLNLGTLRPGVDRRVVLGLLDVVAGMPATTLRVHLREEVLAAGFPRPDDDLVSRLRGAARAGLVDLRVGGRLPEPGLWSELASLAAFVLPYRWGSHSGWVESCFDVGTPVVAPDVGHWAEQQTVHSFRVGASGPDLGSLAGALRRAVAAGPRREGVERRRRAERARGVVEHDRLHRLAAEGVRL